MAATEAQQSSNGIATPVGPHPSFIQVAKPYVFEQSLQQCKSDVGATEAREDTLRLQGVTWIDNVRKALHLPVRSYNTACVYYHKFRLIHPDSEYDYRDAAAAALFNACKIEDTLKKSRDILCAAYNLKLAPADHLSSDDPLFEQHSKTILGLERLMLEASGFDFRNRYPQKMLMKLVKSCSLDRDTAGMVAYKICLDLYRTFAPLKQTTQTMALACLELAIRLCDIDLATVTTKYGFDYDRWATTREEVMETLLDALDLYIHHRMATLIGPEYSLDAFIAVRITLNHEASDNKYPRFTEWNESREKKKAGEKPEPKPTNGTANGSTGTSPQSPSTGTAGEKGKEGTVRFMLDPTRARDEKSRVKEYFEPPKEVEEWIWVNVPRTHIFEESSGRPRQDTSAHVELSPKSPEELSSSIRGLKEQLAKLGEVDTRGGIDMQIVGQKSMNSHEEAAGKEQWHAENRSYSKTSLDSLMILSKQSVSAHSTSVDPNDPEDIDPFKPIVLLDKQSTDRQSPLPSQTSKPAIRSRNTEPSTKKALGKVNIGNRLESQSANHPGSPSSSKPKRQKLSNSSRTRTLSSTTNREDNAPPILHRIQTQSPHSLDRRPRTQPYPRDSSSPSNTSNKWRDARTNLRSPKSTDTYHQRSSSRHTERTYEVHLRDAKNYDEQSGSKRRKGQARDDYDDCDGYKRKFKEL